MCVRIHRMYQQSLPGDEESGLLAEGHAAVGLNDALVPTCRGVSIAVRIFIACL